MSGFGARRQKSAAISYVLFYRTRRGASAGRRSGGMARPGPRIRPGTKPSASWGKSSAAPTLPARNRKGGVPQPSPNSATNISKPHDRACSITRRGLSKKPSTLDGDRGRIERHIAPVLGSLKVSAVTRADVERFRDAVTEGATAARIKTGKQGLARVTGGRGTATRAMGLLGAIFNYAIRQGLRNDNPVRRSGASTPTPSASDARASRNTPPSARRCATMPASVWPAGVAATKFLALTGWRRGEALALQWSEVDLATRTARLADTKTGFSMRPLSHAACDIIARAPAHRRARLPGFRR